MAFIDYYKIMGIPKDTPQKDIRAAYKKRARLFHPDLHPEDPKAKIKFQMLNEANEVLSDPEKRAKYDKYGEQWQQADAFERAGAAQGGGNGTHFYYQGDDENGFDFSQFSTNGGFSSFFEDLFGRAGRASGRGRGRQYAYDSQSYDAEATVNIDMYTALLGGDILLQTQGSKLKLKVKPCTQNGAKIRLRGKGYQKPDGSYGNLIITYNVKLPSNLSDKQKELLQEMRDCEG
jgi:heat shock protein